MCLHSTSFFTQGLSTVVNTALPDLMVLLNCNVEEMSRTLSAWSFGGLVGCLATGVVNDLLMHTNDLNMAVLLIVFGITCAVKPFATSLVMFGAIYAVEGIAFAVMNIGKMHHIFQSIGSPL